MIAVLDMEPGSFYDMPSGFVLPTKTISKGSQLEIGQALTVSCMFSIALVNLDGERVGFYFTTQFGVVNGGAYLITSLKNKGKATTVDVLIRTDELVLYNYPNRGTLAISPLISDEILTIFEEQ
jgi:hypothetical protein